MKRFSQGSFFILVSLWLALIIITDWFFYGKPFGCTLGIYTLLLVGALWARCYRSLRRERAGIILTIILAVLALLQIEHPGLLISVLSLIGLVTLALLSREGWRSNAVVWLNRWRIFARKMCSQLLYDSRILYKWRSRHGKSERVFRNWIIPAILSLGFVFLFSIANPVISRWLGSMTQAINRFFADFTDIVPPARIILWSLSAFALWGLLRLRTGRQGLVFVRRRPLRDGPSSPFDLSISPAFIVRCLGLFNAVFAVQTLLDIYYLWGGGQLPAGMTYAEYAHRGAYPLIAAALLAALFVLVSFRQDAPRRDMAWARRLVYVWIGQNILLTVSSIWRLILYIEIYSLSRLRIGAGIWMFLVAMGLVWICIRILKQRSNSWLINVNVMTLFAILLICCFINFDGLVAVYNVRHCAEAGGKGPAIDMGYLVHLGPESLPALKWLDQYNEVFPRGNKPAAFVRQLQGELDHDLRSWQGWSLRRARLKRRYGTEP